MYPAAIFLLVLVLPLLSAVIEAMVVAVPDIALSLGKWFTFWGVGVRLFLAGLSQAFRPQFTAQGILGIGDESAFVLVREIGFGNLAIGTLGLLSLVIPAWLLPAASAGFIFYGLAGAGHISPQIHNGEGMGSAHFRYLYGLRTGHLLDKLRRLGPRTPGWRDPRVMQGWDGVDARRMA